MTGTALQRVVAVRSGKHVGNAITDDGVIAAAADRVFDHHAGGDDETAMNAANVGDVAATIGGIGQWCLAQVNDRRLSAGVHDRVGSVGVPDRGVEGILSGSLVGGEEVVDIVADVVGHVGPVKRLQHRDVQGHRRALPAVIVRRAEAMRRGLPAVIVAHRGEDALIEVEIPQIAKGGGDAVHDGGGAAGVVGMRQPHAVADLVDQGDKAVAALLQAGRRPALAAIVEHAVSVEICIAGAVDCHVGSANAPVAERRVRIGRFHHEEVGLVGIGNHIEGQVGHVFEGLEGEHRLLLFVG